VNVRGKWKARGKKRVPPEGKSGEILDCSLSDLFLEKRCVAQNGSDSLSPLVILSERREEGGVVEWRETPPPIELLQNQSNYSRRATPTRRRRRPSSFYLHSTPSTTAAEPLLEGKGAPNRNIAPSTSTHTDTRATKRDRDKRLRPECRLRRKRRLAAVAVVISLSEASFTIQSGCQPLPLSDARQPFVRPAHRSRFDLLYALLVAVVAAAAAADGLGVPTPFFPFILRRKTAAYSASRRDSPEGDRG